MIEKRTDAEPQFAPDFDRGLFLGQMYNYLLSTRELVRTLQASGVADSNKTPFGALRMYLSYTAPILQARCEELTTALKESQGGKHGQTASSAAPVGAQDSGHVGGGV